MATVEFRCSYCGSNRVIKYGTHKGRQWYVCKNAGCGVTIFQLGYANNGSRLGIDKQILDMAMNAVGIRDTARVLGISTGKVMDVIKKKASELTTINPAYTEVEAAQTDRAVDIFPLNSLLVSYPRHY